MGRTEGVRPVAARSYPKELMKFFLSQMETSKEAIRVGTLTLIRAVVSADGEREWEVRREAGEAGLTGVWTVIISSFIRRYWVDRGCFIFSTLEPNQHCVPYTLPSTLSSNSESQLLQTVNPNPRTNPTPQMKSKTLNNTWLHCVDLVLRPQCPIVVKTPDSKFLRPNSKPGLAIRREILSPRMAPAQTALLCELEQGIPCWQHVALQEHGLLRRAWTTPIQSFN